MSVFGALIMYIGISKTRTPEDEGKTAAGRVPNDASCSCCYQVVETPYTGEEKARGNHLCSKLSHVSFYVHFHCISCNDANIVLLIATPS